MHVSFHLLCLPLKNQACGDLIRCVLLSGKCYYKMAVAPVNEGNKMKTESANMSMNNRFPLTVNDQGQWSLPLRTGTLSAAVIPSLAC